MSAAEPVRRRQTAGVDAGLKAAWVTAAGLVAMLTGCDGVPQWRELSPPGLALRFALPCRPDAAERRLELAGTEVVWQLRACEALGQTFALGSAAFDDPGRVAPALLQLGRTAREGIGGRVEQEAPASVAGATPQPASLRWRIVGRLGDGRPVVEEVAVFAYGARVYQATVVGAAPDPAAVRTFFERLAVAP